MNIQCNSTSYSPRRGGESHTTSSNTVHVSPIQHQVSVSHEAASPTPRRQIQVRSSIDADIGMSYSNVFKYKMFNMLMCESNSYLLIEHILCT